MRVRQAVCLGLGLAFLQACAFECIYIYVKGYKACGPLEEVVVIDRGGNEVVLTEDGASPSGCTCVPPELQDTVVEDPGAPELEGLYAEIEAEAQAKCVELAEAMNADPAPCESASLNIGEVYRTDSTYEECKYLGAKIDEDKDGYCPDPPEGNGDEAGGGGPSDAGETGTDAGDTGTDTGDTDTGSGGDGPIIPDLPLDFP